MVPVPRILNSLLPFNEPPSLLVEIFMPGTTPCRASTVELTGRAAISFAPTVDTAPVTFTFFCVPNATTTTSSKVWVSSFKITFKGVPFQITS